MAYIGIRSKVGTAKLPSLTWLALILLGVLPALPFGNALSPQTPTTPSKDFIAACQKDFNVTEQELQEFPDEPIAEDVDMKFKCYANCLMHGMGFMDTNGRLDADAMHEMGILSEQSYECVVECKAANDMEDDMCEYSFGIMLCIRMLHGDTQDESEELKPIEEERKK
ncbi:general odorant-binding protein 57c-like [Eurosta solidaginis]|uniref:general odorant-binding protein 57c-like n=1 Tax=Eurosta solidaginis TaxID=178769 RepID=UPI0035316E8A